MDYKIVEKDAFTVMGFSRMFKYDSAAADIPKYWDEHFRSGKDKVVCGMYGVCFDEGAKGEFEYMIADNYMPWNEIPNGCVTRGIPKHTWAVFHCKGPMPDAIQETNRKIYSEWLPNCREYEIAAGYNIELYSNCSNYPIGNQDENYYTEIWIPVRKK